MWAERNQGAPRGGGTLTSVIGGSLFLAGVCVGLPLVLFDYLGTALAMLSVTGGFPAA